MDARGNQGRGEDVAEVVPGWKRDFRRRVSSSGKRWGSRSVGGNCSGDLACGAVSDRDAFGIGKDSG